MVVVKLKKSVKGVMRGGIVKKKPVVKKKKKIQCKDVFSYKNLNIYNKKKMNIVLGLVVLQPSS